MGSIEVRGLWQGYHGATVRGLRKRGEPKWALRGVDLQVAPGEMVGVVGRNGSGKTTLLQTVAGVILPLKGEVVTQGRVASLVDLSAGFHRELTGRENIMLGGVLLGISRASLRERYDDIVAFAGLTTDTLASPLRLYSAGMGLRLGFSLVAHSDPDVLLVDEVLAVGDEEFRAQCVDRVNELRAKGCAVLLISHDLELIAKRCDRTITLLRGEVVDEGDPLEVVTRYQQSGHADQESGPQRRSRRRFL